jgi:uncharacterized protein (DUF1015 family)
MKFAICGSMAFAKEMLIVKQRLEKHGHTAILPHGCDDYISGAVQNGVEGTKRKVENDLIRKHYNVIAESDAIFVVNMTKNSIANYIGGNTFLEIGFAHVLNKKILMLNDIPEIEFIKEELAAMQPTVVDDIS